MQTEGHLALLPLLYQKAIINYVNAVLADAGFATSIDNLNAWGTALAEQLNADAGVTDTDYDEDPQAA